MGCICATGRLQRVLKAGGALHSDPPPGVQIIEYEEFFAWWNSDKGIQMRRKMTRPDATQGPVAGSPLIDSIDRDVLDSVPSNTSRMVESRTRNGVFYKLERKKIEVSPAGRPRAIV